MYLFNSKEVRLTTHAFVMSYVPSTLYAREWDHRLQSVREGLYRQPLLLSQKLEVM